MVMSISLSEQDSVPKKVGRTPSRGSQGYPRKVPFGKINLDKVDIGSMP